MNYYQEIIEDIKKYINNNEIDIAKSKILEELNMPYVPKDITNQLNDLMVTINNIKIDNYKTKVYDEQEIEDLLKGDNLNQLLGINVLIEKNLREFYDLINTYLLKGTNDQAKSILIDALIRQEINETYHIIKDDMDMEFNPRYCECIEDTDSFQLAYNKLRDIYESNYPSYLKFGFDLLVKEYYEALPMTFCEDEVEYIVDKIQKQIDSMFN